MDSISLLSSLTGIGKYTNEVAKHLEKYDDIEMNYFYGYYSKKRMEPEDGTEIKSIKAFLSDKPLLKKVSRKALIFLSKIFAPKFDLYWVPNIIPLEGIKARKIVSTVHDFSFYVYPQWHPQERLDYFHTYFFKNVQKSDWIITGSEFSKKEIIHYLEYPEEKITVINHGVDLELYKVYGNDILNATKNKFDLKDNFLLFVGSIEPRKNLVNLLNAYHPLSEDIKAKYPLILVGFKGWENDEVMKAIEKEKKYVKYLGYLSDKALAHVYNLASLFIYPSLYEGFGIPPLEAMACGTAVISSNAASLPEACGDAVTYIDPEKPEDIADKIEYILNDVAMRNNMILKGLERVQRFTWERSAHEHKKIFDKVLNLR